MKICNSNTRIVHISSNFILSISLLIMFDTLLLKPSLHCNTPLHFTTLHYTLLHFAKLHTSPHFIQLHFTTLHCLVNSEKLIDTREYLTLQARYRIIRCRYKRVQLYFRSVTCFFTVEYHIYICCWGSQYSFDTLHNTAQGELYKSYVFAQI